MEILDAEFAVPVALDVIKRGMGLFDDDNDHDEALPGLIKAATALFETATDRPTVPRVMRFDLPRADFSRWWFPVAPVSAVQSIECRARGGEWVALDMSGVDLVSGATEPQLICDFRFSSLGAAEMRVTASVGYAAGTMPAQVVEALTFMVKDWLEAGLSTEATEEIRVGFDAGAIMRQLKYKRPMVAVLEV
ncbi:hypothetical protein [uncultured Maritimibacter sp.]|jgi:cytochrome c oxidase assembly factor CtaG|uniref:hypothetical protein n=1 Tax=uncultured Maritimibacter sp. TaxID=991866 RepID=UPI002625EF3E|nr:hypothetical protein [uncultured Maritimibacter sp.]